MNQYLREIGKIKSLSREEATSMACQLEELRIQTVSILSQSTLIVKHLLDWIPQLNQGEADVGKYVTTIKKSSRHGRSK